MNPAKRKKIYRAELTKQNLMSADVKPTVSIVELVSEKKAEPSTTSLSVPVVEVMQAVQEPQIQESKLGLQELTKEELVVSEQPVSSSTSNTTNTKKKKV